MEGFNPDYQLERVEQAALASVVPTDGFRVIHRIMKSEVDKFVVRMINTDPANEKTVIAAHLLSKAAAQFYQGVINRINEEITIYHHAPKASDKPVDITEGLIDLGEAVSNLPNIDILGGEEIVNE